MELWDAYKEDETLAGCDLIRGEKIPKGLYHGVAEVFVLREDGGVLVTQRDFNKPMYPGLYESGAAGSILRGESFIEGASRELREETGIVCEDLREIYTVITEDTIYKGYMGVVNVDKGSIILQEGETIAYQWMTKDEFVNFSKSELFVPAVENRLKGFIKDYIKK